MNQDQVKETLLSLRGTTSEFTVMFSGKRSMRVNGLYKPNTREIIIHNKNFTSDNDLLYTAIHEYAHHLLCASGELLKNSRAHSVKFWATFHDLLDSAESRKVYTSPSDFKELEAYTERLTDKITESGEAMREIGRLLCEVHGTLQNLGGRIEDYVARKLHQTMPWAHAAMNAYRMKLDERIGSENMKTVSAIHNDDRRAMVEAQLVKGKSPQQVRVSLNGEADEIDPVAKLEQEKRRIDRTIEMLEKRKREISAELEKISA